MAMSLARLLVMRDQQSSPPRTPVADCVRPVTTAGIHELRRFVCEYDESNLHDSFLIPHRSSGMMIWMEGDDQPYLDLILGFSSLNFGHGHPEVVKAAHEATATGLVQLHTFHTRSKLELSALLVESLQMGTDSVVYYDIGGSNAVQTALRMCRAATQRTSVIAFDGGFHGTGPAAAGVTDPRLLPRAQYGPNPQLGDIVRIPYPNPYRGINENDCIGALNDGLRDNAVAAVIIEPVQGAAGFIAPSDEFLRSVREITSEATVPLVVDEIQSGVGRTGYLAASQRARVTGDIVLLSKSLAGDSESQHFVEALQMFAFKDDWSRQTELATTFLQVVARVTDLDLARRVDEVRNDLLGNDASREQFRLTEIDLKLNFRGSVEQDIRTAFAEHKMYRECEGFIHSKFGYLVDAGHFKAIMRSVYGDVKAKARRKTLRAKRA